MQLAGRSVALLLALVAPLIFFIAPTYGPLLGALAGVWIFVSRVLISPWRDRCRIKGALAQEMFDCDVLGLPWNPVLGKPIPAEEIRNASKGEAPFASVRDWYPTQAAHAWPDSVLICLRSNAVWARRQHYAYAWVLAGAAVLWFLAGVALALTGNATLAAYLTTIALPSLPALLDACELAREHFQAAGSRQLLEDEVDSLLSHLPGEVQPLRELQDGIFRLRKIAPLVPEWFYKALVPSFEEDMQYAARNIGPGASDGQDG